jgi:glucose-6-phosphate 1-dehydrogenase
MEGRESNMTQRDRLMAALFDSEKREHIDVKFFVSAQLDLTNEEFCKDASDLIEAMHDSMDCDESFVESFTDREVSEFLA